MSKSEIIPLTGSYPSPPASPRLTTRDTAVVNRKIVLDKLSSLKSDLLSNEQAACTITRPIRAQPAGLTHNIAPKLVEELREATERLGDEVNRLAETVNRLELAVDELVLETWKRTMLLHEGICGVIYKVKKNAFVCKTEIASWKTVTIEQSIGILKRSNQSAIEMETQLDILARLSCCPAHLNPPFIWDRINKWLVAMPGGPYKATPERELRNKWTWLRKQCSNLTKENDFCGNPVGPKNRYFCKKTVDKMVQIATTSFIDDVTLDQLVAVLQHHTRCSIHHRFPKAYHHTWRVAIRNFKKECTLGNTRHLIESDTNSNDINHAAGDRSSDSMALATPPASPNNRRVDKEPHEYWGSSFDTSAFIILMKGDIFEDGKTARQLLQDIIGQPLKDAEKHGENEVKSGYVYIFTAPGNDGFVKIGFTGRDGNDRHDEWDKSCNRQHALIYTTELIRHAHRVERLVHAELMEQRIRIYCERCGYQHIEWFEASKDVALTSVKKWSLWIESAPYKKREAKWNLKADEAKKVEDMETFLKGLEDAAEAAGDAEQTAKSAATDSERQ